MKHPENLKDVNAVKINDEAREFVNGLAREIDEAKQSRSEWDQRDDHYYRLRFGLRPKKTWPWKDAANYVLPLADSDIQRAKPAYINLVYGVSPAVTYEPILASVEAARKREILMDWRIKHKMDFFKPYSIGVDKCLSKGFVVFKVIWQFESRKYTDFLELETFPQEVLQVLFNPSVTDDMIAQMIQEELDIDISFEENSEEILKAVQKIRGGEINIEMDLLEKKYNRAQLIACDPKDVVVPPDTTDITNARFIDYPFWLSKNDIKIAMQDEKYQDYDDDVLNSWAGKGSKNNYHSNKSDKDYREGVTRSYDSDDLILLHETCVMFDVNNDGILEKCIVTYPDSDPSSILRFIELPYDHGEWPYVQIARELIDDGFFSSRGITALDDDFQTGISESFNNEMNNQRIVSTPIVKHRRNGVKNMRNLRFVPGQPFEVDDMASLEIQQLQSVSQGQALLVQQTLKSWANERLGSASSGVTSTLNKTGAGLQGQKTKREIDLIATMEGASQSLDLITFQMQMQKVYYQIDALYEQFGDEEETIFNGEQTVTVSRAEIQGKFNLVPNGKIENSNPQSRTAKAFNVYQLFANDSDVKQIELKKMLMNEIDPRLGSRLFYTDEEKQKLATIQRAKAEEMKNKAVLEGVGAKRMENALEVEKAAALMPIEGKKYAPN
jgi:hypothetical protein